MQTKLSKQQGNERPQDKRSFVLRIHVRYDNQQQKNMGSRLIKRMNHYQCNDPKFEEVELANHISNIHDVDTTTRSQYLASLEQRIKALEDRLKMSV